MKQPLIQTALIDAIVSTNRCSHVNCKKTVGYRLKVPKRSGHPGNKFMVRYVCREHKDEFIAHSSTVK